MVILAILPELAHVLLLQLAVNDRILLLLLQ
jgi:hypothetical protein